MQRSRDYDYFPTLKAYVDGGQYRDGTFIGMLNAMLGGRAEEISTRTKAFNSALRAFNLITVETNTTRTPVDTYCGVDYNDAGTKCTPCETNFDCTGLELCYAEVKACVVTAAPTYAPVEVELDLEIDGVDSETNSTSNSTTEANSNSTTEANNTDLLAAEDTPVALSIAVASTTNYCGASWTDAASNCMSACKYLHFIWQVRFILAEIRH